MLNEFLRFNRQTQLIVPGDHIICAVSGGADSMALLVCLLRLSARLEITVSVLHCNHHLRAEAGQDAAFVQAFCQEHALDYHCYDLDVTAQQARTGQSLEDAARTLRYACYRQALPRNAKIATAHNAQDNLETTLIHLVRGTSPRGLAGIPPYRERIIRPLLFATRPQILDFLHQEKITFREDATNQTDFCLRNRLRHHVIPLLAAENPALLQSWLDTAQQLRQEDAYLSALAQEATAQVQQDNGFSIRAVQALPPVIRQRVLFSYLSKFGLAQPQRRHLQQLEHLMHASSPSAQLDLPGCRLMRNYDTVQPAQEIPAAFLETKLQIPGKTHIPALHLWIHCEILKNFEKCTNSTTQFTLNYAMIKGRALVVRPRKPGDCIRLRGGSRSLKRYMIDQKIPQPLRQQLPVIADNDTVIAVAQLGVNQEFQAIHGTPCLSIYFESEKEESPMLDDIQKVLLTQEQIQARIMELGATLTSEYRDKNPVFIGVLKGVVVFFSDMIRAIPIPCQIDFMAASSYSGTASSGQIQIQKDVSVDLTGRHVVILEDILDTGFTLRAVVAHLQKMQPASLKICALLDKPARREVDIEADYVGFTIPNEFAVGYGLDYNEKYRNLPFIGVLKPEIYGA